MNDHTKYKPKLRGYFHQWMFFISIGACLMLISLGDTQVEIFVTIIYTIGVLLMFGVSALYHRITWSEQKRIYLRKLDHSAIFVMIAGTFTPVCSLALSSQSSFKLLIIVWSVTLAGVIKTILFPQLPKFLNAILYLIAGYMVIPYLSELSTNMGKLNVALLLIGGFCYSVGALCYGFKKPTLKPKVIGYHEVFHIFVSLGAIFHFIIVYNLVV